MATTKYKSDAVYERVVIKAYAIAFVGGLVVAVAASVPVILIAGDGCNGRSWLVVLLGIATVHVAVWLIIANMMCGTFQAMVSTDGGEYPPTPPIPDELWWTRRADGSWIMRVPPGGVGGVESERTS